MNIDRYIQPEFSSNLDQLRQMLFLWGPRQVGKTTAVQHLVSNFPSAHYFNWDIVEHRHRLLQDPKEFADELSLDELSDRAKVCVFDELHKFQNWRDFLKSLVDSYPSFRGIVTGSARLRVFSRGGDSLRGRYFSYTLHPLSVAELVQSPNTSDKPIHDYPKGISDDRWDALLRFGGFPEPFTRANTRFHNQWILSWYDQVLGQEVRDLTRVQELGQVESVALLLRHQVSHSANYSHFSKTIRSSIDSITRWIEILESLYFCYRVSPWYTNVPRSLRKQPKFYLWDWSQVQDPGARAENFVACALKKAVDWWTDSGLGRFSLHYLRDKQQREVDFVITRDDKPWFIVEVKSNTSASLSRNLEYFQNQIGAEHAFQVVMDAPFFSQNCFEVQIPIKVPARSFLSQLV